MVFVTTVLWYVLIIMFNPLTDPEKFTIEDRGAGEASSRDV
jgi:hypothetical protein